MADSIELLKSIEQDWKDWSEGKSLRRVSMKWVGIPVSVSAAVIVTAILNSDTYLIWGLFIPFLLGLPLWIFLLVSPGTWEEKIEKKLKSYEPLDIEAWHTLVVSIFHHDELKKDDLRLWLDAEFSTFSDGQNAECNEEGK